MGTEWVWVIIAIVVLFGASRLPMLGRNVGHGIREFKKGIAEASHDDDKPEADKPASSASDDRSAGA